MVSADTHEWKSEGREESLLSLLMPEWNWEAGKELVGPSILCVVEESRDDSDSHVVQKAVHSDAVLVTRHFIPQTSLLQLKLLWGQSIAHRLFEWHSLPLFDRLLFSLLCFQVIHIEVERAIIAGQKGKSCRFASKNGPRVKTPVLKWTLIPLHRFDTTCRKHIDTHLVAARETHMSEHESERVGLFLCMHPEVGSDSRERNQRFICVSRGSFLLICTFVGHV